MKIKKSFTAGAPTLTIIAGAVLCLAWLFAFTSPRIAESAGGGEAERCGRLDTALPHLLLAPPAAGDMALILRLANLAAEDWECPLPQSCAVLESGLNTPTVPAAGKDNLARLAYEFRCPAGVLGAHIEARAREAERLRREALSTARQNQVQPEAQQQEISQ